MSTEPRNFEIESDVDIEGTPAQVFEAITNGTAGWLWPMETEPRLGGVGAFGSTVTGWDPPRHYANRLDGADGWFNQLEHTLTELPDGTTQLRYVHSGIFTDDWDNQYDGARQHTAFYLHTLGQYVRHFTGLPAEYVTGEGPDAATAPGALDNVRNGLGLPVNIRQGDSVQITLPNGETQDAIVDFHAANFLGVRTSDALYRFFGRNAFGHRVGFSLHLFPTSVTSAELADQREVTEQKWTEWLAAQYV